MKKLLVFSAAFILVANAAGAVAFATEGMETPEVAVVTTKETPEVEPVSISEETEVTIVENESEEVQASEIEDVEENAESQQTDRIIESTEAESAIEETAQPTNEEVDNSEAKASEESGEYKAQTIHDPVEIAAFIEDLRSIRGQLTAKQSAGYTSPDPEISVEEAIRYLDTTISEYLHITDNTLDSAEHRAELKQNFIDFISSLIPPAGEQPEQPEAPKPEQPEAPKPEQPEAPKPEQPEAPKPEQPEAPKPEQPEAPKPEQPEAPKPEQPEAPKPEQPEAPKPEQPEAPKPEQPKPEQQPMLPNTGDTGTFTTFLGMLSLATADLLRRRK